jgi:lipoprotein-releasing system permease protein
MSRAVNRHIAFTYFKSGRRATTVAILGVLLGISIFIFMNTMSQGFDRSSSEAFFKSTPHIRVYQEDEVSKPINEVDQSLSLISNPQIIPNKKAIENPYELLNQLRHDQRIKLAFPQVNSPVFYNIGMSQLQGTAIGFPPSAGNEMYQIQSFTVQGNVLDLESNAMGIFIGAGIAEKLNVETGKQISVTSSKGVNLNLTVVGVFQTNNSREDNSKSYVSLATAQQLLQEGPSFITDINVNVWNPEDAPSIAPDLTASLGYKAEDWKSANKAYMAAAKMRSIVITFISFTLLIVSIFGIYNILNMTVSQKINEIAILKAMGFNGRDVVQIFVLQAVTIGAIGVLLGLVMAFILISLLQHVYIGGDIGYFPVRFEWTIFLKGTCIGLFITFLAGFIPAKKAAKVDPVTIFRK